MKTLFFTYGTLKSGESRNNVLTQSDSKLVGHGFTERRDCSLRRTDEKPFGFPVFLPDVKHGLNIQGELWEIDTELLRTLDHIEARGYLYDREETPIRTKDGVVNAITYVGVEGYWRSRINRMPFCDTLIWQMGDKSTKTYQFRNS
jgi:gamma-glutamylcyclotransferase (GGCT)/AIG2-like uncharacterized protein YtfP